jgi:hypothetical protein
MLAHSRWKASVAALLPGFLILGCSTWRPVAPDPESFDAEGRPVRIETSDRGSYTMVAADTQGGELRGTSVEWRYTVEDSAAFHALLGAGRSPGEHEESLSWVSIPFSSIVSIEARKPDAPATVGATLAVLVGAGLLGVTVIAIAFATSGGFY